MVALRRSSAQTLHHLQFPNESEAYRQARNALLDEEIKLRRQIERVAAQRRALPAGGELAEDYVFEGASAARKPVKVKLSELFAPGKDTLAIYSFMFGPERERPCPGCTHFLDGLDGAVRHTRERCNFAVVAKSPLPRVLAFADERGWRHLRLLSTAGSNYDRDYFGDSTALTRHAHPAGVQAGRGVGHADAQCVPARRQDHPPFLGLRAAVCAARARPGVSP
jgi:predicted dithiol-disulfide oxidoreductase (DUF899 family)